MLIGPANHQEMWDIIYELDNKKKWMNWWNYDESRCVETVPLLAKFINASFEIGTFPTNFKNARVKPIFIDGKRYRPIYVLSTFSKNLDQRLRNYLII